MKIVLLGTPEVEDKGKYSQLLVKYQSDGKDSERKIMSFTFKEVFDTLKKGQAGDAFEVKLVKDGKYWNWTEVTSLGKEEVSSGMPSKKASGGWETPEERAAKQIYIVRQSSLSSAIATIALIDKKNIDGESVSDLSIEIAKKYEAYVFSKGDVPASEPAEVE
jgi:hypothetical protein